MTVVGVMHTPFGNQQLSEGPQGRLVWAFHGKRISIGWEGVCCPIYLSRPSLYLNYYLCDTTRPISERTWIYLATFWAHPIYASLQLVAAAVHLVSLVSLGLILLVSMPVKMGLTRSFPASMYEQSVLLQAAELGKGLFLSLNLFGYQLASMVYPPCFTNE